MRHFGAIVNWTCFSSEKLFSFSLVRALSFILFFELKEFVFTGTEHSVGWTCFGCLDQSTPLHAMWQTESIAPSFNCLLPRHSFLTIDLSLSLSFSQAYSFPLIPSLSLSLYLSISISLSLSALCLLGLLENSARCLLHVINILVGNVKCCHCGYKQKSTYNMITWILWSSLVVVNTRKCPTFRQTASSGMWLISHIPDEATWILCVCQFPVLHGLI